MVKNSYAAGFDPDFVNSLITSCGHNIVAKGIFPAPEPDSLLFLNAESLPAWDASKTARRAGPCALPVL
jgi:hypothetical protein